MVDQINQTSDVVIPWIDRIQDNNGSDEDENEKIINISAYQTTNASRPLYLIKRKKSFELIRKQFKAKNRLLLKAYNTYAYYSCEITEMQQKVFQHMTSTRAYSLIMVLNKTNQHDSIEKYLNQMDNKITLTLKNLLHNQSITLSQWNRMNVNRLLKRRRRRRRQLNSLYFLPDTRRENVPFYPMMYCRYDFTIQISHFLIHLLQPIYDRVTYSTTFNTSIDVIDAIEKYEKKQLLRSNTQFVTLYIHDLSTIISHEQIIKVLQRFLDEYIIDGRIQGITIQTIIDLVQLFLENQYCLYDNKLYQLIRGSASNSPLTTILANIYMYYWQEDLVTILNNKNEIVGRYFDQIFFTWNESEDKLNDIFIAIKRQYPDIQMAITMNDHINYLDINMSHIDGDLKIEVAHDLNTEPYSLPYVFGHPQHQYLTLPRAALIRAARCYSNVFDFANELHDIQLSFQYNGFQTDFFLEKFQLFLEEFDTIELKNLHYGEAYYDQSLYDHLRQIIFNYNQSEKKTKIKRCQRQTIQYRWPHSLYHDI